MKKFDEVGVRMGLTGCLKAASHVPKATTSIRELFKSGVELWEMVERYTAERKTTFETGEELKQFISDRQISTIRNRLKKEGLTGSEFCRYLEFTNDWPLMDVTGRFLLQNLTEKQANTIIAHFDKAISAYRKWAEKEK